MRTPVVYDYAVIRVVPRVEREEFINAGVLISCQASRTLAAAVALDPARLHALDPYADIETLQRHLDAIVRICRGDADGGPIAALPARARFHWLTARRSSVAKASAMAKRTAGEGAHARAIAASSSTGTCPASSTRARSRTSTAVPSRAPSGAWPSSS